jgi:peptide/nickel transport system substrate-binding protein
LGNKNSDLTPVGSGVFRVLRVKKTGKIDQVVLQSSQARLIFSFYNNREELLTAARVGEIDGFLEETTPTEIRWSNFSYYQIPLLNRYYALFFNLNNENLKDGEFRRSLSLATPKEKITQEVFKGMAAVVDGPLDGSFAESNTYRKYLYDAKLDKNYNINLTLTIPSKEEHQQLAQIIKESWERIGVHLTVTEVSPDKLLTEVVGPKKFEILLLGQEVTRDPDRYTLWHSTQKDLPGLNFTSFKQVRADRSLEEGRKAQNLEDRLKYYENLQTVVAEEVPAIFLYRPIATYAVKKKFLPTGLEAVFSLKDRFADFESWEFK